MVASKSNGPGRPPALLPTDRSLLLELRRLTGCGPHTLLPALKDQLQLPGFSGASFSCIRTAFNVAGMGKIRKSPLKDPYSPGWFVLHIVPVIVDESSAEDEATRQDLLLLWEPFSRALFGHLDQSFQVTREGGLGTEEEPLTRVVRKSLRSLPDQLKNRLKTVMVTKPLSSGRYWFETPHGNKSVHSLLTHCGFEAYEDQPSGNINALDLRPYLKACENRITPLGFLQGSLDRYNLNNQDSPSTPAWGVVQGKWEASDAGKALKVPLAFYQGDYRKLTPQERLFSALGNPSNTDQPQSREAIRKALRQSPCG